MLLTELTDIKDRSPDAKEFYIQTVSLNITMPTREEAYEVLSEAFACIQPYNTERGRQEIISKSQDAIYVPMGEEDWSTGELQYVYSMQPFYWGHEERFKFDPVIDFESNRDYTPTYSPSPLYNRRINSKNPYSPGYYVDGWESYFNHTCDTHLDYRLTEYQDKDDCTLFFQMV